MGDVASPYGYRYIGAKRRTKEDPRFVTGRGRYAAGVTHNEEVCFALEVEKSDVRLDRREHEAYQWLDAETACTRFYWESNKKALAKFLSLREWTPPRGDRQKG